MRPSLQILDFFSEINGWHSSFFCPHFPLASLLFRQHVLLMLWRFHVWNFEIKNRTCKHLAKIDYSAEIFCMTCGRGVSLCLSVWKREGCGRAVATKTWTQVPKHEPKSFKWKSSIQDSVTLLSNYAFCSWHLPKVLIRKSVQTLTPWRISILNRCQEGRKKRKGDKKDRNPFVSRAAEEIRKDFKNRR